MKRTFAHLCLCAGMLLTAVVSQAQPGGGSSGVSPVVNEAIMQVFGKNQEFSAKAEMKVVQAGQNLVMLMDMAMLDGKLRSETDMSTMKGLPEAAIAPMKQMGMDKMVSISRPDLGKTFVIYPGMKSYAEMALPKTEENGKKKEAPVEKTAMGKETVDGHPTVKNKVVIAEDSGKKHEMTVWNATDMKDFPIKMKMNEAGSDIEVLYKNVSFEKPEAAQFEPPKDFEKFESVQKMMMKKMFGGGAPKP